MTYTELRDFLDRYTNERGEIQGDPATIAGEAATTGLVARDDEFQKQIEEGSDMEDELYPREMREADQIGDTFKLIAAALDRNEAKAAVAQIDLTMLRIRRLRADLAEKIRV